MPTCPKCKKDVDSLTAYELHEAEFTVSVDDKEWWPEYDDEGIEKKMWYECPKCLTKLFDSENDAAKFLLQE